MQKKVIYSTSGTLTLESMSQANWYNNWTISQFKKYLQGEILEVGCGIGNFTKILTPYGRVSAIDIDKTLVAKTKLKVKGKAVVGVGDIEAATYFFKNKKFDTITCINVLEHIKYDKKALFNMEKLLKPGGTLILLIPAHPLLYGEIDRAIGHFRRYSKKEIIKTIQKTGLRIVSAKKMNFLGAFGWFMSGRILHETSVHEKRLKVFNTIAPIILPIEGFIEPPFGTSLLIIAQKPA